MDDGISPLNLGLIGCGGIARQYHLRVLGRMRGVEIVAVADPRPPARAHAANLSSATTYEDGHELLARDDVDAVVICAENRVHAELATASAIAGKAFYLEKPLALSIADGRRAIDAAGRSGVAATIGLNFRYLPVYRALRRHLASGSLGEVRAIRTRYCEPVAIERMPAWKRRRESGGGALLDLGTHHLDLAAWLVGERIAAIKEARLDSDLSEHDSAWIRGRMAGGAELEAEFSFRRGRICDWVVECEGGTLTVDRHDLRSKLLARPRQRRRSRAGPLKGGVRALPIPRREPTFALSLVAFVERLRGMQRELPSLEDGLRSLEVVLQAEAVAGAR
jgi:predicted dehydrogenase